MGQNKERTLIRKMLLIAAAVAMPVGLIAATAGTAGAAKVLDPTAAPSTANCTLSGGTITFKTPIGIVTAGGYQAPLKNKGQKIKIAGVNLSCTSSDVTGPFTGVASGKITSTNPGNTPEQEYSCTGLLGVQPGPGGTLTGSLKIKWTPPFGQSFAGGKKTATAISSIGGGVDGGGHGTFTIPGNPGTGSSTGSFPGSDAGASGTSTDATADTEGQLAAQCQSSGGLSSINLGSGTASLQ
ncbi:MAG: hypothetical protein IVW52_03740 [Acidimicrobiales bacterium]|nr:hypothetical protein [Acidimicrobiales bacterium]